MSLIDPVIAITERNAHGSVADFYEDIRSTLKVPVVNLIWRHLATIPGSLEWCWSSLKPSYESNAVNVEASVLRDKVYTSVDTTLTEFCLQSAGISNTDLNSIKVVLHSYYRSNAMNLVSLSALRSKLNGLDSTNDVTLTKMKGVVTCISVDGNMPPLIPLCDMPNHVKDLVIEINKIGGREKILPSMYRHLANWPSFLSLIYLLLMPLEKEGILEQNIKLGLEQAHVGGLNLSQNIPDNLPIISEEAELQTKVALDQFVNGPIGKMTPIVPLILSAMDVSGLPQ